MTVKRTNKEKSTAVTEKPLYHVIHPEELLNNGELILEFSIPGQPATKKRLKEFLEDVFCHQKLIVLMKSIVSHSANQPGLTAVNHQWILVSV